MTGPDRAGLLLVIDTAATRAVIGLGTADGTLLAARAWTAGYRHGEELLARIEGLLAEEVVAPPSLGGLVVGTGPGAFTGLRVGLATAKGLAHALGLPIVGVPTGEALLAAAGSTEGATGAAETTGPAGSTGAAGPFVLLQPAGPSDLVLTRPGRPPRIVVGGEDPGLAAGETLVAVDLHGRADAVAVARGEAAHAGLAAALLRAGARRLRAGDGDDLARLVPEYVTLPRGVLAAPPDDGVELSGTGPPR